MLIGVADTVRGQDALERYLRWLRASLPGAELVVLSHERANGGELDRCSGLVMTGGGDVDPHTYGAPEAMPLTSEVNAERDRFEIGLVLRSQDRQIPLLGICRGLQIVNVAFGGSLVPDLQRAGFLDHRKTQEGDRRHAVLFEDRTLLSALAVKTGGEVNSSHHQAAHRPGEGLRVAARSPDGVIEALERSATGAFLLLVQWHPERMSDQANPLAAGVLVAFRNALLEAAPT